MKEAAVLFQVPVDNHNKYKNKEMKIYYVLF